MNDVGQLFVVGFEGKAPTRALSERLARDRVGGIALFSRNLEGPRQVAELVRSLQTLSPVAPLLICVDQEGGRVARLKAPFTELPPARVVGEAGSEALTYRLGTAVGRELKAVGINVNFAPVLDVDTNPQNPVIGDRAFGPSADLVARLGAAYIRGLQDQGVAATGKHFPGHGDTTEDSHLTLPLVTKERARLHREELPPFRAGMMQGLRLLMSAHVMYPALDPEWPATLSHAILTGLLRDELGYTGAVMTDDLKMAAVR
ncbi:MAG: beta-N-acetylhexosaminidase, partial [Deltaproteobacteria bacterium]|nr:beta-N-acetylhexosaminidase [Deltaproteobacteria bacterium]